MRNKFYPFELDPFLPNARPEENIYHEKSSPQIHRVIHRQLQSTGKLSEGKNFDMAGFLSLCGDFSRFHKLAG